MELPLKVELPRLSHIHVLQLLLPFVPGIVVTVGLALSSSSLAQRFEVIGVGYKTKLAVAVALTYIRGLAVLTVTQTVNSIVMRRIGHERPAEPWNNSYWRRVATTYVGSALSPMSASFSPEDLDRLVKQYAALSTAQNTPGKELTSYREKVLQLDKILSHLRDSVTKVNPVNAEQVRELLAKVQGLISEAEPALHTAKESLDAVENKLRVIGVESEWHWLYEALQFLPTTVQHPFGAFTLLMSSLQAVGLCTLWLMIQYRELWNLVGISFAIVLFLATSHALWLDYKLNQFLTTFCLVSDRSHDSRNQPPSKPGSSSWSDQTGLSRAQAGGTSEQGKAGRNPLGGVVTYRRLEKNVWRIAHDQENGLSHAGVRL